MIIMHLLPRTFLILLLFTGLSIAEAQDAKPCPPEFSENSAVSNSCAEDAGTSGLGSFDGEHGPVQISGGLCPDVPTDAADHVVNTKSEMLNALSALDGVGGVIEVEDGSYSWGSLQIDASGADENNRIHIRSETLYGASFGTGNRWNINGDFVTVSGFTRTHSTGLGFQVTANNARIACHDVTGQSPSDHFIFVNGDNTNQYDDLEVDNNYFRSWNATATSNVWKADKCNSQDAACLGTQQRHHIHHNSFEADSASTSALYVGESFMPQDDNNYFNASKEQTNHLIENNTFDWQGYDTINLKSSRNILRYNCYESGTRVPDVRSGHDNLWYANWFRSPSTINGGFDAGWGTYRVFNYMHSTIRPIVMVRSGQEFDGTSPERWAYISSSEGVFSNNVCDNCPDFVRQQSLADPSKWPLLVGAGRKPLVINSVFQNNLIRRSSTPEDYHEPSDGHTDEAEFKSNNTFSSNQTNTSPKSNVPCFTPGHVEGIGTSAPGSSRLSSFDGSIDYGTSIPAPSWWQ